MVKRKSGDIIELIPKNAIPRPVNRVEWIRNFIGIFIHYIKKPVVANAIYLLGGNILNGLGGFVFWTLAARYQSPENVGLSSAVLSAAGLLSAIGNLGLGYGILRFLPQNKAPGKFLNSIYAFSMLSSMIVSGLFLLGIRLWKMNLLFLTTNLANILGFVLYVSIFTLGANLQSTFLARRLAVYGFMYWIFVNVIRIIAVIILTKPSPLSVIGAFMAGIIISTLIAYFVFLPRVEANQEKANQIYFLDVFQILPYSIGNCITMILEQNIQPFILFVVLGKLGPASSGYVTIAWLIAAVVNSIGFSWAGSAFAESNNDIANARKILLKASIPALSLTIFAALVIGIGAPVWLAFFGKTYSIQSSGFLRMMMVASPFIVVANFLFYYLRVIKKVKLLLLSEFIQAGLILLISFLFISKYGIIVIGLSHLVAYGVVSLFLGLFFFHHNQTSTIIKNNELDPVLNDETHE